MGGAVTGCTRLDKLKNAELAAHAEVVLSRAANAAWLPMPIRAQPEALERLGCGRRFREGEHSGPRRVGRGCVGIIGSVGWQALPVAL